MNPINSINLRKVYLGRASWPSRSVDPERTEGQVQTAGNLKNRISKVLNEGVGKRGDLGKKGDLQNRGGSLFSGVKHFDLDSPSLKSPPLQFPI